MTHQLAPGDEAHVILPPRQRPIRLRLHRIEPNGNLTFIHPRNGALRTVTPTQITRTHRKKAPALKRDWGGA